MFDDLFNVEMGAGASQSMDAENAEQLLKTLNVGHGYLGAPGQLVGGGALGVESLDATLKSVTYDASNLVFWPAVPQDRAYSLVEQYVRMNSYGDGGSPYVPESGSPSMNDSDYNRHAQKVVFFSTRRGVSLASTLVRQNFGGDVEGRETQSGTLWLLEKLERELYKGMADFSAAGKFDGSVSAQPAKLTNLNLSGFEVQLRSGESDYTAQARAFDGHGGTDSVIMNMEGALLSESAIETEARVIIENFGRPGELHLAPADLSAFVKQFFPKERVTQLGVADGKAGYVVREFVTSAGSVGLKANVFLRPKMLKKAQSDRGTVPGVVAGIENAAGQSVVAGALNALDLAAADSKLKAGQMFVYEVTACNEQGESAASVATVKATIAADGQSVSFKILDPAAGNAPTHYAVYRTNESGAGAKEFIGYVARTGSKTAFIDLGLKVQGAGTGYLMDLRPELIVWKQLAPLLKINLAAISTAKEFLLWLSGCLMVFAPRKQGMFENIGRG